MPSRMPSIRAASDRPTLLMVGSGEPMDVALQQALDRYGLFVEAVELPTLIDAVHMTGPDAIFLVGDAAKELGQAALDMLAADPGASDVPVILLSTDNRLASRMEAMQRGVTAVVPRGASADAVAKRVAKHAKEMASKKVRSEGELGEATFDELVDLVKKELRSGILSVHPPGGSGPMRVMLGEGRPVAEAVSDFVARLKPHVTAHEAGAISYEFQARPGSVAPGLLEIGDSSEGRAVSLANLRVLLVDDDPARADALAQELRAQGALVFVTDTEGRGLKRSVGLDPQIAIVDAAGLEGQGFAVVRAIRKDPRLRWASILVAPWDDIWPDDSPIPDMVQLAARIEPLLASEKDLALRAGEGESFDIRLEATGPSRMLRTLVASGATLHVTVRSPKATIEVDVAEHLIVGATAKVPGGSSQEGTVALTTLLSMSSGRVRVEHRSNPSTANVMSPVEEALSVASQGLAAPTRAKASRRPRPKPKSDSPSTRSGWGQGLTAAKPSEKPSKRPSTRAKAASARPARRTISPSELPAVGDESEDESTKAGDLAGLARAAQILPESVPPPGKTAAQQHRRELGEKPTMRPDELAAAEKRPAKPAAKRPVKPSAKLPVNPPRRRRSATLAMGSGGIQIPDELLDEPPPPPLETESLDGLESADLVAEPAAEAPSPPSAAPTLPSPQLARAAPEASALPEAVTPGVPYPELPPIAAGSLPPPRMGAGSSFDERVEAPAPTASSPAVPYPAASSPAASSPAASSPAVSSPAVSSPAVSSPAVSSPAHPTPPSPPRPSAGSVDTVRIIARVAVALSSLVLVAVLAAIAYRHSGLNHPGVDGALALLGVTPIAPAAVETPPVEPAVEPPPVEPPPVEPPVAEPPPAGEPPVEEPPVEEPPVEEPPVEEPEEPPVEEPPVEEPPAEVAVEDATAEQLVEMAGRAGNSDMAERLYRRALQLDPTEHHAMLDYGRLLMNRNRAREAAEQFRGAVRRRPRRTSYRLLLGDALAASGDAAGAQSEYQRVLEIEPDNATARRRLGQ